MERTSRRAEYAENTRQAIVEAATQHFAATGYAHASIDAIADTARVSKGAVYHHFSGKAALFEAAFVALEDELVSIVSEKVLGVGDPHQIMSIGVREFLERCRDEQFRRIVLQDAPAVLGWSRWKELEEERFLILVKALIEALAGSSGVAHRDIDLESRIILVAMGEAGLAVSSVDATTETFLHASALIERLLTSLT